jgi:uncharacterized protein (TIGR02001 family)
MLDKAIAGSLCALSVLASSASPVFAADEAAPPYTLTGHVDVASRYYLRGATTTYGNVKPGLGNQGADAPESDRFTPQWGVDFAHESGFYLGYWASAINYSYKQLGRSYDQYAATGNVAVSDFQDGKSVENDLYGGYTGKLGDVSYTLGLTAYYYLNGRHANATETKLGLAWQEYALNAQTLLNDTVWGNRGDTYWTLNYTRPLPAELTFTASLGWYTYAREGKYLGTGDAASGAACAPGTAFVVNGCFAGKGPISDGFRHLVLGLSQPIGSTGLTWTLQGIIGGDNRFGVNQVSKLVGLISYGF